VAHEQLRARPNRKLCVAARMIRGTHGLKSISCPIFHVHLQDAERQALLAGRFAHFPILDSCRNGIVVFLPAQAARVEARVHLGADEQSHLA
jgi:hypothetical protein